MDINNEQPSNQIEDDIKEFIKMFDEQNGIGQNLSDEPEKLSNASHEIVFNITANVLEENEKGEKIKSKHICTKYYHIPVPLDGDYHIFMHTFFKFLEEALTSSASKTYASTNPNSKQPDINGDHNE